METRKPVTSGSSRYASLALAELVHGRWFEAKERSDQKLADKDLEFSELEKTVADLKSQIKDTEDTVARQLVTVKEAENKVAAAEFDASEAIKSLATTKDLAAKVLS